MHIEPCPDYADDVSEKIRMLLDNVFGHCHEGHREDTPTDAAIRIDKFRTEVADRIASWRSDTQVKDLSQIADRWTSLEAWDRVDYPASDLLSPEAAWDLVVTLHTVVEAELADRRGITMVQRGSGQGPLAHLLRSHAEPIAAALRLPPRQRGGAVQAAVRAALRDVEDIVGLAGDELRRLPEDGALRWRIRAAILDERAQRLINGRTRIDIVLASPTAPDLPLALVRDTPWTVEDIHSIVRTLDERHHQPIARSMYDLSVRLSMNQEFWLAQMPTCMLRDEAIDAAWEAHDAWLTAATGAINPRPAMLVRRETPIYDGLHERDGVLTACWVD